MTTILKQLSVQGQSLTYRISKLAEAVNGVWITVRGRKVFIKDGQNLKDALKESFDKKPKREPTAGMEGRSAAEDSRLQWSEDFFEERRQHHERILLGKQGMPFRAAVLESERLAFKDVMDSRKTVKPDKNGKYPDKKLAK